METIKFVVTGCPHGNLDFDFSEAPYFLLTFLWLIPCVRERERERQTDRQRDRDAGRERSLPVTNSIMIPVPVTQPDAGVYFPDRGCPV